MSKWTCDDIPDQSGRNVIVTGANTGIGFETARALALKGAQVTLACRSHEKGEEAVDRIRKESADAAVSLEQLDLSDLRNVEAFAARFKDRHERLDLLILNAGIMVPPESKTAQGYELQFGVNHLGHFALTGALLPLLLATEGSRVVVVSSTAAARGVMNFDDLQFERRGYAAWQAYAQSKLANQLFTLELQRRLRSAGSSVVVTAAHPGWTATDLQRTTRLARTLNHFVAMKPPQGALPTLRAATDPEANGGDYFGPNGFLQMRGYPKRIDMVKRAHDPADAARLWEVSEDLSGVRFDLPGRGD
ncbi:MAG: oxidoreductase [Candidatus Latescibacterota bacterium]|jgi:NAD(P)-dependent dehydrogenase (short-subunit alcohol dehydrogenase family)